MMNSKKVLSNLLQSIERDSILCIKHRFLIINIDYIVTISNLRALPPEDTQTTYFRFSITKKTSQTVCIIQVAPLKINRPMSHPLSFHLEIDTANILKSTEALK